MTLKGTVYSVAADNLVAHGRAGFSESFRSTYFCRFCLANQTEMQTSDAVTGSFEMRTKDLHDNLVQKIQNNDSEENYGVTQLCSLSYFHPITGFPPDILHDLFEGVVPVEMPHCLKSLIAKKYLTFEELNRAILSFPFQHFDNVNGPTQFLKILPVEEQLVGMGMRTTLCLDCSLFSLAPESQKGTNFGRCSWT